MTQRTNTSQSPAETGRWVRAADSTYRHMRRRYGRAVRYAPYTTREHGPTRPDTGR
jgi:hypothetical protein